MRAALFAVGLALTPQIAAAQALVSTTPSEDLRAIVAQAPEGATILLAPGRYHAGDIAPKNGQTIDGGGKATLTGGAPLANFAVTDGLWRAQGPKPLALSHGGCDLRKKPQPPDHCLHRESLFVGDVMALRVFTRDGLLGDGLRWFQNRDDGAIWLNRDPAGRPVEIAIRPFAVVGAAANVTLRGLTIERYAQPAQHGAVQGDKSRGWRIEDSIIRHNSGGAVRTGHGMILLRNRIVDNGQIGLVGTGDDMLVQDNEIAGNNARGFNPGWEAGGTKFVATNRLRLIGNHVRDNVGAGLWTDIDNVDVEMRGNTAIRNGGSGLFQEIGGSAVIEDNVSALNGWDENSPWGSQIIVSGSIDTIVRRNRVIVAADHGNGIYVVQEGRPNESKRVHAGATYMGRGTLVTENEITFLGPAGRYGFFAHGPLEPPLRERNRFENNRIFAPDAVERFADDISPPKQ